MDELTRNSCVIKRMTFQDLCYQRVLFCGSESSTGCHWEPMLTLNATLHRLSCRLPEADMKCYSKEALMRRETLYLQS